MSPSKLILCSSSGRRQVFKHRMEKKRHIDRGECKGIGNILKPKFEKRDGSFVC